MAPPRRVALALAVWATAYAAYRMYYAAGGQVGMIGTPAPAAHLQRDNLIGAIIILIGAALPLVAVAAWRRPAARRVVAAGGWAVAVGCCMHALTLIVLRVLSLADVHPIHYPAGVWLSLDRRAADLQDLLFNEPWFFVEGSLWALLALAAVAPGTRPAWRRSALAACAVCVAIGLLTGLGALPAVRTG